MVNSIAVIGASGLIGSALSDALQQSGKRVIRISRSQRSVDGQEWRQLGPDCLKGAEVVVNLAGDRIDKRWTEANKKQFRQSRVGLTEQVHAWIAAMDPSERPSALVNTSAVGIYGDRGDEELTESSRLGHGYLAELCEEWEEAAQSVAALGVRVAIARLGVVLAQDSPAWNKISTSFRWGLGGKLGSGEQWFPWVLMDDVVGALDFLIQGDSLQGPYNIVAAESVRNADFTTTLAEAMHRPAFCTAPAFALKLALGDFASALLASQRVLPEKLPSDGYHFEYPKLGPAITRLLTD